MLNTWEEKLERAAQWMAVACCLFVSNALALANVCLGLFVVLWLVSARRPQRWQALRQQPVAWLCIALYAWVLIGALYSTGSATDIQLHVTKFAKILVAAALISVLTTAQWQRRCWIAFMVGMGFVLLTQYAEIVWDLPWAATHQQGWGQTHTAFGDYITQALTVVMLLGWALWQSLEPQIARAQRLLWAAVVMLCLLSVTYLSDGRTGYVLVVVVVAVVIGLRMRGRALLAALALMLVALTLVAMSSPKLRDRVAKGYHEVHAALGNDRQYNSLGGRIENYRQGLRLISERPVWGWGTGSFHTESCRVASTEEFCKLASWHPHNQYLLFGIQGGLIAVGLYLALLLAAAWQAWHATPPMRVLAFTLLSILSVNSLFNSALFSGRESIFFTLMLAVVLAGTRWPSSRASPDAQRPA
jgi:O-antigen ligase